MSQKRIATWRAGVDTIFLTCVNEGDIVKERVPILKKPRDAHDQYWPIGCS